MSLLQERVGSDVSVGKKYVDQLEKRLTVWYI